MRRAARYKDIRGWVRTRYGYSVKTCWIADVMEQNGLSVRRAPNRFEVKHRANPCPVQKREPITEALRHYALI
jgi:hypothetical protein